MIPKTDLTGARWPIFASEITFLAVPLAQALPQA